MPWFSDILAVFSGASTDITDIKQKLYSNDATSNLSDADLYAYIKDIESRVKKMVKNLKVIYKKYNITFNGFKSFATACEYLRESIKNGNEAAYNNLIKLESIVTAEQKRHLALIRMAMTQDSKKVIDEINNDPIDREEFIKIFGNRENTGAIKLDGIYQQLWSEVHKLSEYILLRKNRTYH